MFLLLVSFIAGALTALAPCTLALLPVIVGGSLSGGSSIRRILVVTISLGVSVIVFTFLLKVSTAFIDVPQSVWQYLSGAVIMFLGLAMIFPALWDNLPGLGKLNRSANRLIATGYQKQNVLGDVLVGAALGPVFSSCSPTYFLILATILPRSFGIGLIYLTAYTIGLCALLFVIAFAGQKLLEKLGIASDPRGFFKRGMGVFFLIVGIAIFTGYDLKIETAISTSGYFDESKIEQQLLSSRVVHPLGVAVNNPIVSSTTTSTPQTVSSGFLTPAQKALIYQKAPELVHPDGYINTNGQPITIGQFLGKDVVLVDFWDYSCINCQRTIPYLNAWYQKYKGEGLVIIGVHTPEFAFEHLQSNVQAAVTQLGITYPVVLDNEYQTWDAYQNEYWPNEYLIDIDGYIVHTHSGEGDYTETEQAIQQALAERAARLGTTGTVATSTVNLPASDLSDIQSPETYFGSNRNEYLGNGTPGVSGTQTFILPSTPQQNTLYLGGTWNIQPEYAEAGPGSTILFQYSADNVYMVAANPQAPVVLKVLRDGEPLGTAAGADVDPTTSEVTISGDRLYKLINDTTPGVHTIEIQVEQGTLDAYTFTFG